MKKLTYDQFINYLIIVYAFTLTTTIAGIVLFGHLIILSFLVNLALKKNFTALYSELKNSKVIIVLSLFLLFSLLSVSWSSDKIFAITYLKKYWHFLTIPVIYLSFRPEYIKHVFISFFSGILFSVIMSYGIFFELITFNNILSNNPSPFMNHSDYSLYLAFSSMILLNAIFLTENKNYKLLYVFLFIIIVANLFINSGRTGQIIFVISLFIVLLLNVKHKIMAISLATIVGAGIIILAYNISPVFKDRGTQAYNDIYTTFAEKNYQGSFGIRASLWIMGANVFKENLVTGTGIGDEKTGIQKYSKYLNLSKEINLSGNKFIDYHNMYLQYAVQLGIIGLILMIYLVYSLFIIKFKSILYRNINITFATSILIYSTVGNVLHTIFPMVFFAFFVAILGAFSRIEHKNQC